MADVPVHVSYPILALFGRALGHGLACTDEKPVYVFRDSISYLPCTGIGTDTTAERA